MPAMHSQPDLRKLQETRLRMEAKYLPASPFRQSDERLCRLSRISQAIRCDPEDPIISRLSRIATPATSWTRLDPSLLPPVGKHRPCGVHPPSNHLFEHRIRRGCVSCSQWRFE